MKIKTAILFLALCVTMGVSAQQTDKTFTVKGVSFVMKPVAGGTFQMGYNLAYDECPVHSVTLSSYYIGKTEVTQALWEAVMGSNPSSFKGNNLPVEQVSWEDCQTFITKLNQLTGQKFRLPTEAEWEYAARGGKNSKGYEYSGSNKLGDEAWYNSKKTHPVATKQPNELGIYDMTGNVDEWCQDWYDDSYYRNSPSKDPSGPTSGTHRVYRGHNWYSTAKRCRVSSRDRHDPSGGNYFMGFRLAMSSNSSASTATQKATTASTSTPKTTMTASAGTQVRYHDVEYHEAKGKVKSITYPPGPDETEASIGEFTIDGKEKGPTGAEYDSNGYRVSEKYTPDEDGSITTAKIMWKDGRVFKAIASDKEITYTLNYKYNAKGELIERSLSIGDTKSDFKYQYSDYKYDSKGNWISRKIVFMEEQWTETRTIVYY
jgi:formylglycine-generating enzyme required for sulfatase activity